MKVVQLGLSYFVQNFKLVWERITLSKLTAAYFVFSFCHFVVQLAFQSKAFAINASAASFLNNIIIQGNATTAGFPVLDHDLRLCYSDSLNTDNCHVVWDPSSSQTNNTIYAANMTSIPALLSSLSVTASSSVLPASAFTSGSSVAPSLSITPLPSSSAIASSSITHNLQSTGTQVKATITVTPIIPIPNGNAAFSALFATSLPSALPFQHTKQDHEPDHSEDEDDDDNLEKSGAVYKRGDFFNGDIRVSTDSSGQTTVILNGEGYDNGTATLDESCLFALNWPASTLDYTKREDIAFIAFQFWVFGMSTVALLNESIPHIIASLLTHLGATAWAGFQLFNTANFKSNFDRVITNGACKDTGSSHALLTGYWSQRAAAEIPSLALNALALVISVVLSWKLLKSFGWQTFKRVGASRNISRIYKFVLTLSITIQLSVFFMAVSASLWLDQLCHGNIGRYASAKTLYMGITFTTLILLLPWLMTGWFSVRREFKIPMFIFLTYCVLYLVQWGAMFLSDAFRWTFIQWRFFSVMASISVFLTFMTFVLGLICRWNFNRGLPRYLQGQHILSDDDEFLPSEKDGRVSDMEEKVEFPSSSQMAIPTYAAIFGNGGPESAFSQGRLGPRFYNSDSSMLPFASQAPTLYSGSSYSSTLAASSAGYAPQVQIQEPEPVLSRQTSRDSNHSGYSFRSNTSGWGHIGSANGGGLESRPHHERNTSSASGKSTSSRSAGQGAIMNDHTGGGKRFVIE